jgi:hypothetical protein
VAHKPASLAVLSGPLVIPQGADWSVSWLWAEGNPAGLPAGWPGSWIARMEVRESRGGALLARFHTADVTDGVAGPITLDEYTVPTPSPHAGLTAGGKAGRITVQLAAAASEAWTWVDQSRPAPFDLELKHTSGRVVRFLEGGVLLSGQVTTGG